MLLKIAITTTTTLLTLSVLTACSSSRPGAESSPSEQRSASPAPFGTPPRLRRRAAPTAGRMQSWEPSCACRRWRHRWTSPSARTTPPYATCSKIPLRLTLEDFAGREKVSYLPEGLEHSGSPGSDPEDGDLIYFVPWGNLGFSYNAEGVGYSDQTIHVGWRDGRTLGTAEAGIKGHAAALTAPQRAIACTSTRSMEAATRRPGRR
jgi:hypothetical protein